VEFASGKRALLIVEEGQPEYIEQSVNQFLRNADIQTRVIARVRCPWRENIRVPWSARASRRFVAQWAPGAGHRGVPRVAAPAPAPAPANERPLLPMDLLRKAVPPRPPGLCTGCPERPFFSSMKIVPERAG